MGGACWILEPHRIFLGKESSVDEFGHGGDVFLEHDNETYSVEVVFGLFSGGSYELRWSQDHG